VEDRFPPPESVLIRKLERSAPQGTKLLLQGHFELASKKHTAYFIDKRVLLTRPHIISELSFYIASHFYSFDIEIVVGPALGGVLFSNWVAYHLTQLYLSASRESISHRFRQREVLGLFSEKRQKKMVFHDQFVRLLQHKRVLIVEDIITTGGTVKKVLREVERSQGYTQGVGALWNRGLVGERELLEGSKCGSFVFHSLVNKNFPTWDKKDCPLCKEGKIPLVNFHKPDTRAVSS